MTTDLKKLAEHSEFHCDKHGTHIVLIGSGLELTCWKCNEEKHLATIAALQQEVETLREEAISIGYVLCSWPGKDDLTEYGKGFNAGVQRYMDKLRALASHEEAAPREVIDRLQFIADNASTVIPEEVEEVCDAAVKLLRAAPQDGETKP